LNTPICMINEHQNILSGTKSVKFGGTVPHSHQLWKFCSVLSHFFENFTKKWLKIEQSTVKDESTASYSNATEMDNYRTLQWYSFCRGWPRRSGADTLWWQVSEAQQWKRWQADCDIWLTESTWQPQFHIINYCLKLLATEPKIKSLGKVLPSYLSHSAHPTPFSLSILSSHPIIQKNLLKHTKCLSIGNRQNVPCLPFTTLWPLPYILPFSALPL